MSPQALVASPAKPSKLFHRINEVAQLAGVKPYVLRYWESEFPELAPEKDASDHRRYRSKDIDTVFAIRKLLYEDRFTIKGARQRLKAELRRGPGAIEVAPKAAAKRSKSMSPKLSSLPARPEGRIGETLFHLRQEVNELLKILNA